MEINPIALLVYTLGYGVDNVMIESTRSMFRLTIIILGHLYGVP